MATYHEVKPGECIASISTAHGFFRVTLEEHPENAALRERRGDLSFLEPGDRVFVPDKRLKELDRPTGQRHVFRRRGVPERLRLRALDDDGNPREGVAYELEVDGAAGKGRIGPAGWIEAWISPSAEKAILRIAAPGGPLTYAIDLGYLRPITDVKGVQARLKNLGFYHGAIDGQLGEATKAAVQKFQEAQGLSSTGELDGATRDALLTRYEGR
jgi:Putative peptidoglycan binding domain